MHNLKPNHILLIEDNEGDILLTTEALEEKLFAWSKSYWFEFSKTF